MKIVFYASQKPREQRLARAFKDGAIKAGHSVTIRHTDDITFDCDLACMVGVKSIRLWHTMRATDIRTMMFDKGYSRHKKGSCWEYWRIALDGHQPSHETLSLKGYGKKRFARLGFNVKPWRESGEHILIAGSSEKYHNFHGLATPTMYAQTIVNQLRKYTDRPIIYRPKPSWRDAVPIKGASFSAGKHPLESDLKNCHAIVTHGSNTCFDAAMNGIPSIVLGQGVLRPISSRNLSEIEDPELCVRNKLFNALAYHQWTLEEFSSGEAFETIERWL